MTVSHILHQRTGAPARAPLIACLLLLALSACGATSAVAPQPAAPPAPPKERLVSAIEAQGCVLTGENVGAILAAARLTPAELEALTLQLDAEGRAEVSGAGSIRVLSDNCI